jgi:hypothetical protein
MYTTEQTITHEGIEYRLEERIAERGELVVITNLDEGYDLNGLSLGNVTKCVGQWPSDDEKDFSIFVKAPEADMHLFDTEKDDAYLVLVPIAPADES